MNESNLMQRSFESDGILWWTVELNGPWIYWAMTSANIQISLAMWGSE